MIKDGSGVRFWLDHWLPGVASIHELLLGLTPQNESNFTVASFARDGQWNWDLLHQLLLKDICAKIAVI